MLLTKLWSQGFHLPSGLATCPKPMGPSAKLVTRSVYVMLSLPLVTLRRPETEIDKGHLVYEALCDGEGLGRRLLELRRYTPLAQWPCRSSVVLLRARGAIVVCHFEGVPIISKLCGGKIMGLAAWPT